MVDNNSFEALLKFYFNTFDTLNCCCKFPVVYLKERELFTRSLGSSTLYWAQTSFVEKNVLLFFTVIEMYGYCANRLDTRSLSSGSRLPRMDVLTILITLKELDIILSWSWDHVRSCNCSWNKTVGSHFTITVTISVSLTSTGQVVHLNSTRQLACFILLNQ